MLSFFALLFHIMTIIIVYFASRAALQNAFTQLSKEITQLVQQSPAPPPTARDILEESSPVKLNGLDVSISQEIDNNNNIVARNNNNIIIINNNNNDSKNQSRGNLLLMEEMSDELQIALALIDSRRSKKSMVNASTIDVTNKQPALEIQGISIYWFSAC